MSNSDDVWWIDSTKNLTGRGAIYYTFEVEPLIEAALDQTNPSPALRAALTAILRVKRIPRQLERRWKD